MTCTSVVFFCGPDSRYSWYVRIGATIRSDRTPRGEGLRGQRCDRPRNDHPHQNAAIATARGERRRSRCESLIPRRPIRMMPTVKRVLLTGMSATGKSAVISELVVRGYKALDTDYDGLSEFVDLPPGSGQSGVRGRQDWLWREDRIAHLLSTEDADVLFIGGCAANQVKFYGQFDHIVLLTAPPAVMTERLASRTNNPYGKRPEELARALALKQTIEPMLRRVADFEIDTSVPLEQVVDRILDVRFRQPPVLPRPHDS